MSQASITSYFNSRKRPACDEILSSKNKKILLDNDYKCDGKSLLSPINGKSSFIKLKNNKTLLPDPKTPKQKAVVKLSFDGDGAEHQDSTKAPESKCELGNDSVSSHPTVTKKLTSHTSTASLSSIKQKLKNNPRLNEMRMNAAKLRNNIKCLKEASSNKTLKEFSTIELELPKSPIKKYNGLMSPRKDSETTPKKNTPESPSKEDVPLHQFISPRKVFISPVKSPTKVPAYIRHASLSTSMSSLPLPHHYRLLGEIFRGMETVVSLFFNRKENITFNKLKVSVQEMIKHNFTFKHLGQIKHLASEMYDFDLQKVKTNSITAKKDTYELYINPLLTAGNPLMTPKILLERRRQFYERLLALVKSHHADFLLNLDPPMFIADNKLTRWHPEFELEKIPEVTEDVIPQPPNIEKISTAEEVLSKAKQLFSCNTRMERALEKLSQAKAKGLTEAQTSETSNVTFLNPALRNLPPALLAKVKAKQAAKALEAMTRSTEDEKKALVFSRLPDLARTLRNVFVTERKNVLSLKVILSKLDNSFKSKVSAGELEGDLKILSEALPEWLSFQQVRNMTYLKLDKTVNMENIRIKLDKLASKYQY